MKFKTKRYEITKVGEADGFNEGIQYEINLADGYIFESDGTSLNYASDFEDLRGLIAEIVKE